MQIAELNLIGHGFLNTPVRNEFSNLAGSYTRTNEPR